MIVSYETIRFERSKRENFSHMVVVSIAGQAWELQLYVAYEWRGQVKRVSDSHLPPLESLTNNGDNRLKREVNCDRLKPAQSSALVTQRTPIAVEK